MPATTITLQIPQTVGRRIIHVLRASERWTYSSSQLLASHRTLRINGLFRTESGRTHPYAVTYWLPLRSAPVYSPRHRRRRNRRDRRPTVRRLVWRRHRKLLPRHSPSPRNKAGAKWSPSSSRMAQSSISRRWTTLNTALSKWRWNNATSAALFRRQPRCFMTSLAKGPQFLYLTELEGANAVPGGIPIMSGGKIIGRHRLQRRHRRAGYPGVRGWSRGLEVIFDDECAGRMHGIRPESFQKLIETIPRVRC